MTTPAKALLAPVYFQSGRDADYERQVATLRALLAESAEVLEPTALGAPLPEADAVVFPQMLGDAYRQIEEIRAIDLPRLVITSEFGTMSMWDWEIGSYLRDAGIEMIAPYNLNQTRQLCAALAARRALRRTKYVVYQDNPGEGFQASIFKRFYWWEDECTRRILDRFGVQIVKKSFKALGAEAKAIADSEAEAAWQEWQFRLSLSGIPKRGLLSALKLYLALRRELDADPTIGGLGINCLNESHFSDTTPCLAWNMLYEERRLIWGCEADTVSMLTKHVLHQSLNVPVMMTNLYPFLMGQAALKHERIVDFPAVSGNPADYVLAAHCGYLGVLPKSFSTSWTMRPKVLAIVDPNSIVIDARLPEGPITLAKLNPNFERLTVIEGELTGYAQYPGSDCLNGAVVRIPNGHRLMTNLLSHHYIFLTGHQYAAVDMIARVFGLGVDVL
jgi:hypothetical protein